MKWSQTAIGNFTYYYYPFEYFLDSMERLNIGKIELWLAEPHLCLEDCNYAGMRKFAQEIGKRESDICCVTP